MAPNIEQRLSRIENELKALKSVYVISGSSIETYLSSEEIQTSVSVEDVKIKFTPDYGNPNPPVYSVYAYGLSDEEWVSVPVYISPQDENNEIILILPDATPGETYKVELTAPAPGTFSQISQI